MRDPLIAFMAATAEAAGRGHQRGAEGSHRARQRADAAPLRRRPVPNVMERARTRPPGRRLRQISEHFRVLARLSQMSCDTRRRHLNAYFPARILVGGVSGEPVQAGDDGFVLIPKQHLRVHAGALHRAQDYPLLLELPTRGRGVGLFNRAASNAVEQLDGDCAIPHRCGCRDQHRGLRSDPQPVTENGD